MPPHLRPLNRLCQEEGCGRSATEALHSTFNNLVGVFCLRHAEKRLAEMLRQDNADRSGPMEARARAAAKKPDAGPGASSTQHTRPGRGR